MSTILPFPQRPAHTCPQPDAKPVPVNVTSIHRDLARDLFNEARIRVLGEAWKLATIAHDQAAECDFWERYSAAVSRRSAAQVDRMERERGLR